MRVLVECCLQEQVFNKYYSVLAAQLCRHDKEHRTTLQVFLSLFGLFSSKKLFHLFYALRRVFSVFLVLMVANLSKRWFYAKVLN